jgi:L-aminopeptidase/D-esterase-like protein
LIRSRSARSRDGARNAATAADPAAGSITDVPGIRVGHWTDRRGLTGCTVVLPDRPAVSGADVRGAAPGTRETDLLRPGNLVQHVHAVVLAGGSAFGLEAASGVVRYLAEHGRGFPFSRGVVPIVPAAILFDLLVGRPDAWPDADAGYRAAASARTRVAEGSVGAGTGATVAKTLGPERAIKGGIGTASEHAYNGLIAGAIAAVNASGDVYDTESGRQLAGPRADDGSFDDATEILREGRVWQPERPDENTVLCVVATNAALTKEQTNRLATVCHDGLARAVRPAHTQSDGDTIFTLATGDHVLDGADYRIVEALATRAVERAIARGVTEAESMGGVPSYSGVIAKRDARIGKK